MSYEKAEQELNILQIGEVDALVACGYFDAVIIEDGRTWEAVEVDYEGRG